MESKAEEYGVALVKMATTNYELEKRIGDCRFRQMMSGNKGDWMYWQKEINKCRRSLAKLEAEGGKTE